jgi:hypothetical protein
MQLSAAVLEGYPVLPELTDARWEAFAQGCAKGLNNCAAYRRAGFLSDKGGRLAANPKVAARIEELKGLRVATAGASLRRTIVYLLAEADAGAALGSAAGLKEARAHRLEANRLWEQLEREEARARRPPRRELTVAEWNAKYGAPAPGSA